MLMMQNGFAAESAHIDHLDPAFEDLPILRQRKDVSLDTVMSNSFGFGGTNGCMILSCPRLNRRAVFWPGGVFASKVGHRRRAAHRLVGEP